MKIELYDFLPAVYRNRDAMLGEPLRALLAVLGDEIDFIRQDIDRLYDNWFIETCDEWVVPYIGDLLGVGGLHPGRPEVFSLRPFVANTLAYRRRKGTASVLENIAQDVSGWAASVVEFFQLITTAQHTNHVRLTTVWSTDESEYDRVGTDGTLDLRKGPLVASLGTAFDTASRTIDIRRFTQREGWHNIDRLGIFIWRLRSYPMRHAVPLADGEYVCENPGEDNDVDCYFYHYYLHPCQVEFPLFVDPERRIGATQRTREWEVPRAIGHDEFVADMERYYGDEKSLLVTVADVPIDIGCIGALDMGNLDMNAPDVSKAEKPAGCNGSVRVYIDVTRGRLLVGSGQPIQPDSVRVAYHYGFSANIGGGPYGRPMAEAGDNDVVIQVAKGAPYETLTDALSVPVPAGVRRIVRIMDNDIYIEELLIVTLSHGEEVVIEAADGMRPTIKGYVYFQSPSTNVDTPPPALCRELGADGTPNATLHFSGILFQAFTIFEGRLDVSFEHCTILPDDDDAPSIFVTSLSYYMGIDIYRSIVGPLNIDSGIRQLRIRDSIVDANIASGDPDGDRDAICGDAPGMLGPQTRIERSTIFGNVYVRAMPLASDSIFMGNVQVIDRQDGCMRYCYVDGSFDNFDLKDWAGLSRTPRRFRCQPDLALARVDVPGPAAPASELERIRAERELIRKQMIPLFQTRVYGRPEYGRLASFGPEEIRKGAESGSEMGVFNELMEPQREANLREGVRRYLPFGLEMNILYADEEIKS